MVQLQEMPPLVYVVVSSAIVFFNITGTFGNLNIIWATYRNPSFRGKHCLFFFTERERERERLRVRETKRDKETEREREREREMIYHFPAILITINAGCHVLCLLSELINAYFILYIHPIIRSVCFPFILPYIGIVGAQAVIFTAIAADLFISVNYPAL